MGFIRLYWVLLFRLPSNWSRSYWRLIGFALQIVLDRGGAWLLCAGCMACLQDGIPRSRSKHSGKRLGAGLSNLDAEEFRGGWVHFRLSAPLLCYLTPLGH